MNRWLEEAKQNSNPNLVIMLIANKKDLEHKRAVSYSEGEAYANQHGLLFMEASAKLGDNVEEAFVRTAMQVLEHIRTGAFVMEDESHGIKVGMRGVQQGKKPEKSSCC